MVPWRDDERDGTGTNVTSALTDSGRVRALLLSLLLVVSAVGLGVSLPGTAAGADGATTAATITVDDGGGADYASIQAAVDAAAAGDTIEVRSGTYREEVTVDETLTIVASDGATLNGSTLGGSPVGISIAGGAAPEITGLTVVGYYRGIDARGPEEGGDPPGSTGDWTLRDVTIRNASFGPVFAGGSTGDWTIEGSVIAEDGDNFAVEVNGATGDWTVRNSTIGGVIYAPGSTGQWTIEGVTVRNVTLGSGIRAEDTGKAWTIRDTTVRNVSSNGIYAASTDGAWTLDNVTIVNATNSGVTAFGSTGDWTVRDSTFASNGDDGVTAHNTSGDWAVLGSTLRNNGEDGIGASRGFEAGGSWAIHDSTITGNAEYGVDAEFGAIEGDATRNWWGTCDGPSGDFGGSGDAAVGNLTVEPYYTDAARTTLSNETTAPCAEPFDFGVELEQEETVTRGSDVNVSAYPNNRVDTPVTGTTVELLVDADDDGRFASDEVVASRNADFAASEYREVVLTYENVGLSTGQYTYLARITKDDRTVRSFTNGTLTVVAGSDGPDVTGNGAPARDPDGDELFEDVNGDGDVTPGDATVLFNAIFDDNTAVTDNPALFDFSGDGQVTPGDATVLFEEIF